MQSAECRVQSALLYFSITYVYIFLCKLCSKCVRDDFTRNTKHHLNVLRQKIRIPREQLEKTTHEKANDIPRAPRHVLYYLGSSWAFVLAPHRYEEYLLPGQVYIPVDLHDHMPPRVSNRQARMGVS